MTNRFGDQNGLIFISSSDNTVYPVQLIPNMSSEDNAPDSLTSRDNVFDKVPKLEWTNPPSEISDNNKDPYHSNSSQTSFQNNSDEQYYNFQTPKEELFNVQEMDCSIVLDEQHTDNVLKNSETSMSKTKVLNCSRCMYQTSDKNNMTNHMRKHNSTFVCKICKTSFSVITSLIDHFNKQHPQDADDPSDLQHYCPMCPFQSIEKLEYDKHITRHETAAHTCSICGQPFAKQVSMKWHIKYKHGIEDSEEQQQQQRSNISETSTTAISDHNNTIAANTEKESKDLDFQNQTADMETDTKPFFKRFFCLYCPKNFSNKLYLKYHCWRNHKDRLYKSQWKEVQDLFQQNWNETDPTLIAKSLHAKNSPFQCPMCSFSSSYKSTVDRHIKKHNEAKYSCNICGMPFTVIGNLHHHKKVNHPEILIMNSLPNKRHKCALCIYSTGYKSTLERHLRTHGIAKYHCELCTMPFVFSGSFLTHRMLKHKMSSKDFEETIFTDKITDASSLTASSGKFIKRRKCPYCNALMPSASKLNRHLRTHRNAGYYCVCCSIFYTLRSEFENHMKVHLIAKGFNEVQCIGVTKGTKDLSNDTTGDDVDGSGKNHLVNSEQSDVRESSLSNEISNMNNVTELGNVDKNCDMYSNSSNANDSRNHLTAMAKDVVKIDLTEPVPTTNILLEQQQVLQNESQSYPPESYQNSLNINSAKKLMLSSPSQEITPSFDKPTTEENFHLTPSSRNSLVTSQDNYTIDRPAYVSQMSHEQYFETDKQDFRLNSDEVLFNSRKMYLTPQQQNNMNNSNPAEIQAQNPFSENNNDDMCACKLTPPIHGDVLINPPFKGRFAKLVSDFDDFASRPFACSLCFYRCSILKDLFDHVQNHLTGCTPVPVPNTAKFDTQNYIQGMSIDQNNQIQNNSLNISYI